MWPCEPEADFTGADIVFRIQHKAANDPIVVTMRERKAAATVTKPLPDIKMSLPGEKGIGMIKPVRMRHPPEPAGDSPVIQAVQKVPPVFGAESAKCQTSVYNKMHATH